MHEQEFWTKVPRFYFRHLRIGLRRYETHNGIIHSEIQTWTHPHYGRYSRLPNLSRSSISTFIEYVSQDIFQNQIKWTEGLLQGKICSVVLSKYYSIFIFFLLDHNYYLYCILSSDITTLLQAYGCYSCMLSSSEDIKTISVSKNYPLHDQCR